MNIEKKKKKKPFISVVVSQKWFYHLKCLIFGQVCSVYLFVSGEHTALDFICTSANRKYSGTGVNMPGGMILMRKSDLEVPR